MVINITIPISSYPCPGGLLTTPAADLRPAQQQGGGVQLGGTGQSYGRWISHGERDFIGIYNWFIGT